MKFALKILLEEWNIHDVINSPYLKKKFLTCKLHTSLVNKMMKVGKREILCYFHFNLWSNLNTTVSWNNTKQLYIHLAYNYKWQAYRFPFIKNDYWSHSQLHTTNGARDFTWFVKDKQINRQIYRCKHLWQTDRSFEKIF